MQAPCGDDDWIVWVCNAKREFCFLSGFVVADVVNM